MDFSFLIDIRDLKYKSSCSALDSKILAIIIMKLRVAKNDVLRIEVLRVPRGVGI